MQIILIIENYQISTIFDIFDFQIKAQVSSYLNLPKIKNKLVQLLLKIEDIASFYATKIENKDNKAKINQAENAVDSLEKTKFAKED